MRKNRTECVFGGSVNVDEQPNEPQSLGEYMTRNVAHLPYAWTKSLAVNLTEFIERIEYYATQLDEIPVQRESSDGSMKLNARPILLYPERLQRVWAGDVEYDHTADVPKWITENVVGELLQSIDDVAEIWVDFQLGDLLNWSFRMHRMHRFMNIFPVMTIVTHDRHFAQLCHEDYIRLAQTDRVMLQQSARDAHIVSGSIDMHTFQYPGAMYGNVRLPEEYGYYDVVKWRDPDGTRRILPFRELHIRKQLFITTILLELAVESSAFLPNKFYGSFLFIMELVARLDKQNAMVETKRRRAIVKASAVGKIRSVVDGKEGSMVWSDAMDELHGLSHRQHFPNYDACMTSTDYQTNEQLYHLAKGMGLNPPRGKRGDPQWRRALCRLLTGASLTRRESV